MPKRVHKREITFTKKTKRRYKQVGKTHRKKLGPKHHLRHAWYTDITNYSTLCKKGNRENKGSYLLWYRQTWKPTLF